MPEEDVLSSRHFKQYIQDEDRFLGLASSGIAGVIVGAAGAVETGVEVVVAAAPGGGCSCPCCGGCGAGAVFWEVEPAVFGTGHETWKWVRRKGVRT